MFQQKIVLLLQQNADLRSKKLIFNPLQEAGFWNEFDKFQTQVIEEKYISYALRKQENN